jgi:filamentous hemagglutinin family protein
MAIAFLLYPAAVQSRPVADETLGNERTIVTPDVEIRGRVSDRIDGGARRGGNLFHSFQEFNVEAGRSVYFTDPGVKNILTRITGGGRSQIDGRLGVLGNANLFLLNPNGVVFGANASLDVRGSFVTSTADSLVFENDYRFSAVNPDTPPLLTLSVPIGLQFGSTPGGIQVQGSGHNLSLDSETGVIDRRDRPVGLQVGRGQFGIEASAGQTLALVGGELAIEGGNLTAAGGRIELGSVAGGSLVRLTPTDPGFNLSYAGVNQFQDIRLTQAASVDSSGNGGGGIQVQGRAITLSDGSAILSNTSGRQAGAELRVRASDSVELIGSAADNQFPSGLFTNSGSGASADGGNLFLTTDRLRVVDGGQISASTSGVGNTGNLRIQAQSVEVIGSNPVAGLGSLLSASPQPRSTGKGGNLSLTTDRLRVVDGAQISTSTFGAGDAGNLRIQAQSVEVTGSDPTGVAFPSGIFASAQSGSSGNGGNLTLTTDRLRLADGGQMYVSTFETGNAGNLRVQAHTIEVIGTNPDGFNSILAASAESESSGDGGNLTLTTDRLQLADGGQIFVNTSEKGNAGNLRIQAQLVEITGSNSTASPPSGLFASADRGSSGDGGNLTLTTDRLQLANGGQILASTFGVGNAGNLTLQAQSIESFSSLLAVSVERGATGDGGNLTLITDRLRLADGGQIAAQTFGEGNAGDLRIQARSIEATGSNPDGFASGLFAGVSRGARGNGGDLTIVTDRLRLAEAGTVATRTAGIGDAGSINIQATSSINLSDGGTITSSVENGARGNSSSITLDTPNLSLDNAQIRASTDGAGRPGSISILDADTVTLDHNSTISTAVGAAAETNQPGNIDLQTQQLTLSDRSTLTASTAAPSNGGTIGITAGQVEILDRSRIAVNSLDIGRAGDINISAQTVQLNDRGRITAETRSADGGNINLRDLDLLLLQNRSRISASAEAITLVPEVSGDGGNVTIDADFIVSPANENSDIRANARRGNGGRVTINSQGLFGIEAQDQPIDRSDITASSERGVQGTVEVTVPDTDPERGAIELPTALVDRSDQIAQACPTGDEAIDLSKFVITGRGGLPPNLDEILNGDAVQVDLVTREAQSRPMPELAAAAPPIVEAQGWVKDANGTVRLVGSSSQPFFAPWQCS